MAGEPDPDLVRLYEQVRGLEAAWKTLSNRAVQMPAGKLSSYSLMLLGSATGTLDALRQSVGRDIDDLALASLVGPRVVPEEKGSNDAG